MPYSIYLDPENYVNEYLRSSGGSDDMGVDGSVTPVPFIYAPPEGKKMLLGRLLLYMESESDFIGVGFMHLPALANGVRISAGGVELSNWRTLIDVIADMFNLAPAGTAFSKEKRSLAGRWTFTRGTTLEPIVVMGGESIEALIRDDLSAEGIIFKMKVQGKLK
jgi:hypothetical protein